MRWFVLIVVLAGILWAAHWSYHYVDNAILITDFWKVEQRPSEWGLMNFKDSPPAVYEYVGTQGFWNIFKSLWPIWTLFTLSFFVLIPLSIYIFNSLNNNQITRAKKAESDAKIFEEKVNSWAEEKVNNAYKTQLKRVNAELELKWAEYNIDKNKLLEREKESSRQERLIKQREENTDQKIKKIQHDYAQELSRFKNEIMEITKRRDNAIHTMQRMKEQKQSITNILKHSGWTYNTGEPVTWQSLIKLSKNKKQP